MIEHTPHAIQLYIYRSVIIECIDSSAHSSTSVRSSSRFQLLAISAILHDNDRARFGARSAMVSVLPSTMVKVKMVELGLA